MKRLIAAVKDVIKGKPFKMRSSKWDNVRDDFIEKHKTCAACGKNLKLQVHHIIPFHLAPEKELDIDNLIVLCEGTTKCHLRVGHLGKWKDINPNVKVDAAKLLKMRKSINK
jgi:5-methylcytosine-specific restriction endonuclease McrA